MPSPIYIGEFVPVRFQLLEEDGTPDITAVLTATLRTQGDPESDVVDGSAPFTLLDAEGNYKAILPYNRVTTNRQRYWLYIEDTAHNVNRRIDVIAQYHGPTP